MGNVRVAHYLASFHKNVIFVKTRCCFICPPSLAEMDCVQGWTRYKSSRCLYANCARCTVSVQTRVDHRTRMRFKNWRPCQFLNFEFLRSKNSAWLFTADILVSKWHMIAQVKIRQADFNLSRRLHFRWMKLQSYGVLQKKKCVVADFQNKFART